MYSIMSSIMTVLLLFQFGFFFSSLIAVVRVHKTMLNKSGKNRYLCLVSDLERKCFQLFTTEYVVSCELFSIHLNWYTVKTFPIFSFCKQSSDKDKQ